MHHKMSIKEKATNQLIIKLGEPSKVVWTKNGVEIVHSAQVKPVVKTAGSVKIYGLEFTKTLPSDNGQYAVTVFGPDGKSISSQTELIVSPRVFF